MLRTPRKNRRPTKRRNRKTRRKRKKKTHRPKKKLPMRPLKTKRFHKRHPLCAIRTYLGLVYPRVGFPLRTKQKAKALKRLALSTKMTRALPKMSSKHPNSHRPCAILWRGKLTQKKHRRAQKLRFKSRLTNEATWS